MVGLAPSLLADTGPGQPRVLCNQESKSDPLARSPILFEPRISNHTCSQLVTDVLILTSRDIMNGI